MSLRLIYALIFLVAAGATPDSSRGRRLQQAAAPCSYPVLGTVDPEELLVTFGNITCAGAGLARLQAYVVPGSSVAQVQPNISAILSVSPGAPGISNISTLAASSGSCTGYTIEFLVPVDAFADNGTTICLNASGAVLSNGTAVPTVRQCQLFKPCPEGRIYAVNMAFTNQSTASTDAASVTVMASWSEAVTNFTQQNLQVTGCGGSNISYFGQVPAQPSIYLAQVALPAQCQGTVTVDVVGTFSSNRAMGPQVLSEPVSGVSFEKTSVAPALETQAVSIFPAFTQS